MDEESKSDVTNLNLEAVIGFAGGVVNGLVLFPDGIHTAFPLGNNVVIRNQLTNTQSFLQGHTDKVTCIALSRDGRFLASGQKTDMGFKAPVIVWDTEAAIRNGNGADRTGEMLHKLLLHRVSVQDLDFSPDGDYLATLGGVDDNSVVIWRVDDGAAICGSPAASHQALTVRWFNTSSSKLVTAGSYTLRTWDFDSTARKLHASDCSLGSLRRVILSAVLDSSDSFLYCGTQTGDLLEVNASNGRFIRASRNRFSLGTTTLGYIPSRGADGGSLILGNGDGSIALLDQRTLRVAKSCQLMGKVTSVSLSTDGSVFFAGTDQGNSYRVPVATLEPELRGTAHHSAVNAIVFPAGSSELFLTASFSDIRVWNAETRLELLRVQVPGLDCRALTLSPDGRSIISGWDDGKIRAFYPQSGKLQWVITDAHAEAVTALAVTHTGSHLVSGGKDGRVRVWSISGQSQVMVHSMKEHKRAVTSLALSADSEEAVSSGADGACIIWNLKRGIRSGALFASTLFRDVVYHPDESQLLTCGSDRKISYWDAADGNAIRIMEASTVEIRSLAIEPDGKYFASGGADKLLKLWKYDEGTVFGEGSGHSGTITTVAISPDQRRIVSVGEEGGIFVWTSPLGLARDYKAEGYVPRADVEDEVDDVARGLPTDFAELTF